MDDSETALELFVQILRDLFVITCSGCRKVKCLALFIQVKPLRLRISFSRVTWTRGSNIRNTKSQETHSYKQKKCMNKKHKKQLQTKEMHEQKTQETVTNKRNA